MPPDYRAASFLNESPQVIRTMKKLSSEDPFNLDKAESDLVTSIKNYYNNYAEVLNWVWSL